MSKIHEALEKAERERNQRQPLNENVQESSPTGIQLPSSDEKSIVNSPDSIEREKLIDKNIVCFQDSEMPVAEEFRSLRTILRYSFNGNPKSCIGISSPGQGEGKSTIAANIAATLSLEPNANVLLIDADLRAPNVHQLFGLDLAPGLADILTSKIPLEQAIHTTAIDNLKVVTAGNKINNPVEVLSSNTMKKLIQMLKTKFTYIIFDTAPILPVTDTSVLSVQLDGTILVVEANRTQQHAIEKATKLLEQSKASILGIILNKVRRSAREYYYYYNYYSK